MRKKEFHIPTNVYMVANGTPKSSHMLYITVEEKGGDNIVNCNEKTGASRNVRVVKNKTKFCSK